MHSLVVYFTHIYLVLSVRYRLMTASRTLQAKGEMCTLQTGKLCYNTIKSEQSITRPQSLKYVIYSTTTDWCTFNHLYRKRDLQPLSEILGTFGTDIIRNLWPESRNRHMRTRTLTQCLPQQYHLRNPVCQIAGYAPGPGYKHWPSLIALIPNWFSKWEDT